MKNLATALLIAGLLPVTMLCATATDVSENWIDYAQAPAEPDGNTYTITCAEELAWMALEVQNGNEFENNKFLLEHNIDLAGKEWTPIGGNGTDYCFEGNFDGQEHVISNLTIHSTNNEVGFFGDASIIQNVGLEDVDIQSTGNSVGGLSGRSYSIENCYVTGTVIGENYVGGLVGETKGDLYICYATGTVIGSDYVGGLIGHLYDDCESCYAICDVSGNTGVGGLIGDADNGSDDCYWSIDAAQIINGIARTTEEKIDAGIGENNCATGLSTEQMKLQNSYTEFDFQYTWHIDDTKNNGFPIFIWQLRYAENWLDYETKPAEPVNDTYTITSAEELAWVAKQVLDGNDFYEKTFMLANDIDLSGKEWTPIGGNGTDTYFSGIFDGNGYVINNLHIVTSVGEVGLFGHVNAANITGVTLINGMIIADRNYIGGLVGWMENSTITACKTATNINGGENIGGMIGMARYKCAITDCTAAGNITGGTQYTGGLIGCTSEVQGTSNNYCVVERCYANGKVSGFGRVGGLIGSPSPNSHISNSYATGDVIGDYMVGGLIGTGGYINNCYSTGTVTGTENTGGFIGSANSPLTNCYYANIAHTKGIGYKGNPSYSVTALTASELQTQTSFTDWDFEEIWAISTDYNGGMPYLRWQASDGESGTITAIRLSQASLSLIAGQSTMLLATAEPSTTSSTVTWASTDEAIATVSNTGVVCGITEGTTTIVATSKNNPAVTATCTVTVTGRQSDEYQIESIAIYDESGNPITAIPKAMFYVEIAVRNVQSAQMDRITVATYSKDGKFLGLQYMKGSIAQGAVAYFGSSIDNRSGQVGKMKAFVFESLGAFTPLCEAVTID